MHSKIQNIARFFYALPMAVFGIDHFLKAESMKALVPAFIPGDILWVYLTGAGLIAAAVSIMIKKQVWWSTMLLSAMLMGFVFTIHLPGMLNGQMPSAFINMLKDIGLTGAALYIGDHLSRPAQETTVASKSAQ